jgi:hypothetical protein
MNNKNKHYYIQSYRHKRHYPRRYQNNNRYRPPSVSNNFFQGNLAQNMKFGSREHQLSGYVKREIVVIDQYGNKQIAKEQQFFNSGKNIGRVRINGNESEF